MQLARATGNVARQLASSPRSVAVQAVGATMLAVLAPEWALVANRGPLTLAAALLATGVFGEALVGPSYFAAHRRAGTASPSSRAPFGPLALRALSAGAVVVLFRAVLVVAGLLPGLGVAFLARWLHLPWLRAVAAHLGTAGVLFTLLCGSVVTVFATRAAVLEGASPFVAVGRSAAVAGRTWLGIAVLQSVAFFSTIALLGTTQILPLLLVAIGLRWARDLALSVLFDQGRAPVSLPPSSRRPLVGLRLAPGAVAVLLGAGMVASADSALADGEPSSLVGQGAPNAGRGAPVAPSGQSGEIVRTGQQVTAAAPAELSEATRLQLQFQEANNRMADAEEQRDDLQRQLATVTAQLRSGQATPELAAQRRQLVAQLTAANRLVDQRRDEVYAVGNQILSRAYGSDYGFLARNWIDMKNTPSFLLGIAESTPQGAWNMVRGVGTLATRAYDWATGAPSEPTVQPTAGELRQQRLAERQQMLNTELARIGDGAATNRSDGNWYGENVVGPLVGGEAGALVVRGAVGVVASRTAARDAQAAAELARTQRLAQAESQALEQATAGLPRVEGSVTADALGQGSQYIPFRLADGTEALAFRGDWWELRDARAAIDAMNQAQPGVMPRIYGTTRLANGETALVLERYDGAQVLMHAHDQELINQSLARVMTPEGLRAMRAGELGRGFDLDYAFRMPDGSVRLGVPRRADQFRDIVDSGRVFLNTVPRVGPK